MKSVLDYCEDVSLADDGVVNAVELYLGAGVSARDNLVANLEGHNNLFAVNYAAGTYRANFVHFGLFLR